MKRCPECHRTYIDTTQAFCLYDGKPLETVAEPSIAIPVAASAPVVPAPPPLSALDLSPLPSAPSVPALPPVSPPTYPPSPNPASVPSGYGVPLPLPAAPYPAPAPAPKSSKLALLPVGIVVALIVLFSLFRQNRQNQPASPGNVPAINVPATPSGPSGSANPDTKADAAAIANAIRQSDEAESQALRTLDPAPLSEWYAGAALQRELTQVESLKTQGRYAETHLDKQDFQNAEMSKDGQQTKVRVVETWTSTTYDSQTRQPVSQQNAQTVPQTVTLQRNGDKWIVTNVEQ